jgi:hypothetical protein
MTALQFLGAGTTFGMLMVLFALLSAISSGDKYRDEFLAIVFAIGGYLAVACGVPMVILKVLQ